MPPSPGGGESGRKTTRFPTSSEGTADRAARWQATWGGCPDAAGQAGARRTCDHAARGGGNPASHARSSRLRRRPEPPVQARQVPRRCDGVWPRREAQPSRRRGSLGTPARLLSGRSDRARGVPLGRRVRVHRTRMLDPQDFTVLDGIPVTGVARTLLDLASVLRPPDLEIAIDRAERSGLFDLDAVVDVLDRARGKKGATVLRRVIAA